MKWLRKATTFGFPARRSASVRLDKEVDASIAPFETSLSCASLDNNFQIPDGDGATNLKEPQLSATQGTTSTSADGRSETEECTVKDSSISTASSEIPVKHEGPVKAKTENGEWMYLKETLLQKHIAYIDQFIEPVTEKACAEIIRYADEGLDDGWAIQSNKNTKVYKKFPKGEPMIGKSVILFEKSLGLTIREILFYIWDTNTKAEYDPYMDKNIKLLQWSQNDAMFYQSFKGRFGVAGRFFILGSRRKVVGNYERACIGVTSVEWEEMEEQEEYKVEYSSGFVRGHALLAGFDLKYMENGDVRLTYLNQADLKSQGIPDWITNRVKLDQLNVLEDLKKNVLKLKKENKLPTP